MMLCSFPIHIRGTDFDNSKAFCLTTSMKLRESVLYIKMHYSTLEEFIGCFPCFITAIKYTVTLCKNSQIQFSFLFFSQAQQIYYDLKNIL